MLKILSFLIFSGLGLLSHAQSPTSGNNTSDTSHRHNNGYSHWRGSNGRDSLYKRTFNDNSWTHWRGMASNSRFDGRGGMKNGHRFGIQRRDRRNSGIHYSPEQHKQLMAINSEYRKKREDLYKNDNLTLREYKAGLVSLQKDKKARWQNLLTPEQKNSIAEIKKKRDEDRQVNAAGRLERMKIRLSLTDQQTASIKLEQQKLATEVRTIRENDNLLAYQKKEQIKQLSEKQQDELKSILTADQLSQLENMRKQHFGGR